MLDAGDMSRYHWQSALQLGRDKWMSRRRCPQQTRESADALRIHQTEATRSESRSLARCPFDTYPASIVDAFLGERVAQWTSGQANISQSFAVRMLKRWASPRLVNTVSTVAGVAAVVSMVPRRRVQVSAPGAAIPVSPSFTGTEFAGHSNARAFFRHCRDGIPFPDHD